jgi:hypothetical protein
MGETHEDEQKQCTHRRGVAWRPKPRREFFLTTAMSSSAEEVYHDGTILAYPYHFCQDSTIFVVLILS